MYRETEQGLRHYVKQDDARVVSDSRPAASRPGDGRHARSVYGFPLPIFGINYLDFEFGNPDTQLALLFARRAGRRQRSAAEARADAARRQRRFLRDCRAVERSALRTRRRGREGERVLTWPLSTGLNLGWQYTPFQKATLQYQFRFDGYVRDRTTAEAFIAAAEHRHQRHRRRLGVPARRIQPGQQRDVVPARSHGRPGAPGGVEPLPPTRSTAPACRVTSISMPSRRSISTALVRRRATSIASGSISSGCSTTRGIHGVPGVRRAVRRAGDGARLLLVQYLRPVPARPVPRAGLGPRRDWTRDWRPITGSARPSTCARRGIRSCARTSGRACLPDRLPRARLDDLQICC